MAVSIGAAAGGGLVVYFAEDTRQQSRNGSEGVLEENILHERLSVNKGVLENLNCQVAQLARHKRAILAVCGSNLGQTQMENI